MQTCQELELLQRHLVRFDAEFVFELAHSRTLHPHHSPCFDIIGPIHLRRVKTRKWVRTACVGPHRGERDFFLCTLLEEKPALGIEEHHREGTVQLATWPLGTEDVRLVLVVRACEAGGANRERGHQSARTPKSRLAGKPDSASKGGKARTARQD